jgi:hypothetical protein
VVPMAIRMLGSDPSPHVRVMAVGLLGEIVHRQPAAVAALKEARRCDPDPMVRKKAGWLVPGGPIFERTRPKPPRKTRTRPSRTERTPSGGSEPTWAPGVKTE